MEVVDRLKTVLEDFSDQPVDFLVVYIEEAHAIEGWNFDSNKYQIHQHKTLQDRMSAAKMFAEDTQINCTIVVDNINDEANKAYGAVPERLYIIYNGVISYEGGRGPQDFNIDEMLVALRKLI